MVQTYVVFSLIWSVGANIHDDSRKNFARVFKAEVASIFPDLSIEGDIYDYGLDQKMHRFEPWDDQLSNFEYDPKQNFFEILVPTTDTTKYQFILRTLTTAGANVMITGETGVGKSVIVKDYLTHSPDNMVASFVNFSGKTTTKNLQDAFEGNLDAKRRNLLGPPGGKQMIFFIDDVNMPQLDRYGSQPPVELLRQTIDHRGFYDTKKLFFKEVQDTKFVVACAPPSGGRNSVTPRLFRHFNMIWAPELSVKSMEVIFTQILKGFLDGGEHQDLSFFADHIIKGSVEIYQTAIKSFLPTPTKCHYTFNLRDMSKVVQGMLEMQLGDIKTKDVLVSLWVHETYRVFRDRLIDESDRTKFNDLVHKVLTQNLSMEWELA